MKKIYEIFSKRQKRLRGEVPDVYQYETIPSGLRVQVIHIWRDIWGEIGHWDLRNSYGNANDAYVFIHDKLCREYGILELGEESNPYERVGNYLLNEKETEKVIDIIEVSFRCIDPEAMDYQLFSPMSSPDEAINELNYRFREHGVGYQYESGQIIKVDSQFIHSEVVKPALFMLSEPMHKGANEEFLKAHEHYRKKNYKDCVNNCLKAFESCLKVICKKRGWNYTEKDTANRLIAIVLDKGLIPPLMQSHFSGLRSTLESGVPTFRNKRTGHGQGPNQTAVPEYIAAYILHLTASNILLLAKADEEMK